VAECDERTILQIEAPTLSNIQEVTARSGRVIAIAIEGDRQIAQQVEHTIHIPPAPELLLPILEVVPLQLLPTTSPSAAAATSPAPQPRQIRHRGVTDRQHSVDKIAICVQLLSNDRS